MNSRNSRFNQKRIQTLAFPGADDKVEDDFGKDDKDREIYRSVTKEIDSADEKSKYKLQEIEQELKTQILILKSNFLNQLLTSIKCRPSKKLRNLLPTQLNWSRTKRFGRYDQIIIERFGQTLIIKHYPNWRCSKNIMDYVRLQKIQYPNMIVLQLLKLLLTLYLDHGFGMKNFANKYQSMPSQFSISIDDYNEIGTQKWEIFKQHPFSNIVD
ncbi:unnamed protein product (macronuclear) [Paramecium tetraurelia]|uniref:Uncharacterized protein n=1 Tax=Paramecium tetraurelia TaxID=5888 RepID=A0BVL0_PARTE|nr:uncharacterized protein GSPATT00005823001 [Paramecium tetraurelia]CAK62577.1 unnamed protein product [Paramecium tetraurelia]|eukprot:XP_001429975.1 hypothetical protein (macronuclear) [Paramecium tetraurelia strain d4-2]